MAACISIEVGPQYGVGHSLTPNPTLAQKFLGHSDLSATADISTHTLDRPSGRQRSVAAKDFWKSFPIVLKIGFM
jgi:integrase